MASISKQQCEALVDMSPWMKGNKGPPISGTRDDQAWSSLPLSHRREMEFFLINFFHKNNFGTPSLDILNSEGAPDSFLLCPNSFVLCSLSSFCIFTSKGIRADLKILSTSTSPYIASICLSPLQIPPLIPLGG